MGTIQYSARAEPTGYAGALHTTWSGEGLPTRGQGKPPTLMDTAEPLLATPARPAPPTPSVSSVPPPREPTLPRRDVMAGAYVKVPTWVGARAGSW